jgi:DNA-binding response OmpR family regulator
MNKRILLVEDDRTVAQLVKDNLEYEGFSVEHSPTGTDAVALARQFKPDLVLLDLMLPNGVDGLEICRGLTALPERLPVIVLTAKGEKEDRVRGLRVGADDYVVKPFALDELLARIDAVLRRSVPRLDSLTLGRTRIDFRHMRAFADGKEIIMTDREFEVLRHFGERVGVVVSRDELLRIVWGYSDAPLTRAVDNFVFRLRHKIEKDPKHPRYIRTAYGVGYRLTLDPSDPDEAERSPN